MHLSFDPSPLKFSFCQNKQSLCYFDWILTSITMILLDHCSYCVIWLKSICHRKEDIKFESDMRFAVFNVMNLYITQAPLKSCWMGAFHSWIWIKNLNLYCASEKYWSFGPWKQAWKFVLMLLESYFVVTNWSTLAIMCFNFSILFYIPVVMCFCFSNQEIFCWTAWLFVDRIKLSIFGICINSIRWYLHSH